MTRSRIYVHTSEKRSSVPSLFPYLFYPICRNVLIEKDLIPEALRESCRWIGCGIGKGVTHSEHRISVFGVPDRVQAGLHGELIQGFPDVDPPPLCYDHYNHVNGFGGFIRWVYFASYSLQEFLGVDFSIISRPHSGVANSVSMVTPLVTVLASHGVPCDSEVVLLNWRMYEENEIKDMRYAAGLVTVQDWVERGDACFSRGSSFCPRCGLETLTRDTYFCNRCGAKPALFWERR